MQCDPVQFRFAIQHLPAAGAGPAACGRDRHPASPPQPPERLSAGRDHSVIGNNYQIDVWLADNFPGTGTVTVSFGATTGIAVTGAETSTIYALHTFSSVATGETTDVVFGGTVTIGAFFIDDVSIIDLGPAP